MKNWIKRHNASEGEKMAISNKALLDWLESWKLRARKRSMLFGICICALLVLALTVISALIGYRVAYDDGIINALRLVLVVGLAASIYWLIKRPTDQLKQNYACLLYTSPSPRDQRGSRMPSSA